MRHNFYVALLLILWAGRSASQDFVLYEDFSGGIPADFTLYDVDGLEPSVDMSMLGFGVGLPWITVADGGGNNVACSTSWYALPGTSNDWLVTPAVTITDENFKLLWRAKATDANFRDGYAVYISTNGASLADFDTSSPAFSVLEEATEWTVHRVELGNYIGQQVWIAFVNNSTDKSKLFIDDIRVGIEQSVYIRSTVPSVVSYMGETDISGTVYTEGDTPIQGFTVGLEYDGMTFTQEFDTQLTADNPVNFILDHKPNIDRNQTLSFKLWVQNGDSKSVVEDDVTAYVKGVVADEFTGTWCGFCPRGIVMMRTLKEQYPNNFIGISVHSGDVMSCYDYNDQISEIKSPGSYPYMMFMRDASFSGDVDLMESYFKTLVAHDQVAGMDVNTDYDDGTGYVNVYTDLWFIDSHENADYKLAYVVIENNVHCPDNDEYNQSNYYSGGQYGEMGGFENMPEVIPAADMYYQEVVRGYAGDFGGVAGSIPSSIEAGQRISSSYSFKLPESVLIPDNVEVIVMITDAEGKVVNAMKAALTGNSSINELPATCSGIEGKWNIDGTRASDNARGIIIVRDSDGKVSKVLR